MTPRFIVAEISKNWVGEHGEWEPTTDGPLLCQLFETAIALNLQRGYRLHSFQLHRVALPPDALNETIIAVFELEA
jgi:hypothetical protein